MNFKRAIPEWENLSNGEKACQLTNFWKRVDECIQTCPPVLDHRLVPAVPANLSGYRPTNRNDKLPEDNSAYAYLSKGQQATVERNNRVAAESSKFEPIVTILNNHNLSIGTPPALTFAEAQNRVTEYEEALSLSRQIS